MTPIRSVTPEVTRSLIAANHAVIRLSFREVYTIHRAAIRFSLPLGHPDRIHTHISPSIARPAATIASWERVDEAPTGGIGSAAPPKTEGQRG